jgi:hypothetical protein
MLSLLEATKGDAATCGGLLAKRVETISTENRRVLVELFRVGSGIASEVRVNHHITIRVQRNTC